jgi:hypothetical protein
VSLERAASLSVPRSVVARTEEALREAGDEGYELFVLWSGSVVGRSAYAETAHLPRQRSYKTESGLLVRVEGEELHLLNAWLFENKELLLAQVHAHPTDAFHSKTDDAYPIVTALGGFSIVAPDFARDGMFTDGTATYRLTKRGWRQVSNRFVTVAS